MAGRDGAGRDDGLGFVLEVVRFLFLRSDVVVGEDVEEDVRLTRRLSVSG